MTATPRRSSQPASTASVANASGVVNGQMMPSSGTSSAPSAPAPEVRLAPVELLGRELADRLVAVRVRLLDDARQRAELLLAPGHEQRPGPLDRDADPLRVAAELLVAAHDELGLERPRLRVEARVQQSGVRLARAGADVGARLEQRHAQVEERQLAGDRAADDAAAGYQDIAVEPALHAREYPVRRVAAPTRARISSIESSVQVAKKPPTTSRTSSSDSAR